MFLVSEEKKNKIKKSVSFYTQKERERVCVCVKEWIITSDCDSTESGKTLQRGLSHATFIIFT
jgi:hypothetical protein